MAIVRLQRRGMLTLPRAIRHQLQLTTGQALVVRIQDGRRIVLEALPALSPDDLFDRYPISGAVTPETTRAMIAEAVAVEQEGRDRG
ncbi:MAG: AbrB/MazE/SpoVT family DNA-binding domain-containing protein [Actinomycetia bacterium]|nr:AbrB/MazE/SpoVT family DNA-binding domain-containing protein [Actinomycetes bacterium]